MKTTTLFTFACVLAAASSQATTLTFDSLGSSGGANNNAPDGYSELGYQFNNLNHVGDPVAFAIWQNESPFFTVSPALFNNYDSGQTRMTQVGGGSFDMTSIDLRCLFLNASGQTVTFTGTRADTSTVVNSFTLSNPDVLTTFAFSGMTNIVQLDWTQTAPYHQFDNVVINGAVPEPASLAVLGLGALALVRRRRK